MNRQIMSIRNTNKFVNLPTDTIFQPVGAGGGTAAPFGYVIEFRLLSSDYQINQWLSKN